MLAWINFILCSYPYFWSFSLMKIVEFGELFKETNILLLALLCVYLIWKDSYTPVCICLLFCWICKALMQTTCKHCIPRYKILSYLLIFAELEQTAALKYLYGWLRHHPKYGTLAPPEMADSLYYADVSGLITHSGNRVKNY